jgi:hypothetical protein
LNPANLQHRPRAGVVLSAELLILFCYSAATELLLIRSQLVSGKGDGFIFFCFGRMVRK